MKFKIPFIITIVMLSLFSSCSTSNTDKTVIKSEKVIEDENQALNILETTKINEERLKAEALKAAAEQVAKDQAAQLKEIAETAPKEHVQAETKTKHFKDNAGKASDLAIHKQQEAFLKLQDIVIEKFIAQKQAERINKEKAAVLAEKERLVAAEKLKTAAQELQAKLEAARVLVAQQKLAAEQAKAAEIERCNNAHRFHKQVVAVGIGTGPDWDKGFSLQGSYAYRIHKLLSVGVQANLFLEELNIEREKSLFVGIKTDFHVLPLFVETSKYDAYVGATWGSLFEDRYFKFNSYSIYYVGASYNLSTGFGVFAEIGNVSSLGLKYNF